MFFPEIYERSEAPRNQCIPESKVNKTRGACRLIGFLHYPPPPPLPSLLSCLKLATLKSDIECLSASDTGSASTITCCHGNWKPRCELQVPKMRVEDA